MNKQEINSDISEGSTYSIGYKHGFENGIKQIQQDRHDELVVRFACALASNSKVMTVCKSDVEVLLTAEIFATETIKREQERRAK